MWSKSKLFSGKASRAVTSFLRPAPKQVEQFIYTSAVAPNNTDTLINNFLRQYELPTSTDIAPIQTAMIEPLHDKIIIAPVDMPMPTALVFPQLVVPKATLPITPLEKPALPVIDEIKKPVPFIATISSQEIKEVVSVAPSAAKAPKPKPQNVKSEPIIINVPTLDEDDFLAGAPVSAIKMAYMNLKGKSDIIDLDTCASTAGTTFIKSFEGYKINPDFTNCMTSKGYISIRKM